MELRCCGAGGNFFLGSGLSCFEIFPSKLFHGFLNVLDVFFNAFFVWYFCFFFFSNRCQRFWCSWVTLDLYYVKEWRAGVYFITKGFSFFKLNNFRSEIPYKKS